MSPTAEQAVKDFFIFLLDVLSKTTLPKGVEGKTLGEEIASLRKQAEEALRDNDYNKLATISASLSEKSGLFNKFTKLDIFRKNLDAIF